MQLSGPAPQVNAVFYLTGDDFLLCRYDTGLKQAALDPTDVTACIGNFNRIFTVGGVSADLSVLATYGLSGAFGGCVGNVCTNTNASQTIRSVNGVPALPFFNHPIDVF